MEPVDDVNVGVEDDETAVAQVLENLRNRGATNSIENYEEAVAQVLEKLRNRGATNSLKRILAFANEELTASDHGLAEGPGKSKRLIVDLPREILSNIFARLSVPGIVRLGSLSKEWRPQVSRDFQQECDQARPKMFALISKKQHRNRHSFSVRVFDLRCNSWHAFEIPGGFFLRTQSRTLEVATITAASEDGGLVCFVSTFNAPASKKDTTRGRRIFRVTVINPLTKLEKKLPFTQKMSMVHMVKITTDAQTQRYKVLLVGSDLAGRLAARVYNPAVSLSKWSRTTRAPHGTTLGYKYHWGDYRCTHNRERPAAYDPSAAAGSQLVDLFQSCPLRGSVQMDVLQSSPAYTKPFCLHQDRVFVLNKDSLGPGNSGHPRKRYYVTEYSIDLQPPFTWALLASHRCEPFENPPQALYRMALHACEGFLLVVADLRDPEPAYSHVIVWLYDLTTLEWRELPKPPQAAGSLRPWDDLMCTLRWNSHP